MMLAVACRRVLIQTHGPEMEEYPSTMLQGTAVTQKWCRFCWMLVLIPKHGTQLD